MRDNKDFDGSKLDAAEVKLGSQNPIFKWLDNFWYYHKWTVIIVLFFAVVLGVGVSQMIGKEKSGEAVVIAAPQDVYTEHIEGYNTVLTSLMPATEKGGRKSLQIYPYPIYSEDEMKRANEEETDDEGRYVQKVIQSYNTSKIEEYRSFLQMGECSILFVSEYLYETQRDQGRLRSLEEVFGKDLPMGAMGDGYGVRLGDTALYAFFDELQALPEDTVICLLRPYIWGASSKEEHYAYTEEFFKNIVTFGN